jgi:cardiolipin synthase A/B
MSSAQGIEWNWLRSGDEVFPAMLDAIDSARLSVRLESYIFSSDTLGQTFLASLVRAARRGVRVLVLVDAVGSINLLDEFWQPLREAGGEARFFNPLALHRFEIRNHRKLLACDNSVAFIGGFNISSDFEGDGVTRGWRDIGMRISGPLVDELGVSFDQMFAIAEFRHKRPARLRRAMVKRHVETTEAETILIGGPGRGRNPIKRALHVDLSNAGNVRMIAAYFLPTGRIRRDLGTLARRGGDVQLLLAGKSDVPLSQLAAQSLYARLLKAGVQIHEYQPQILHAKLFILDDIVYVGSANLDPRSLSINYELMLRFHNPRMAGEAREIFQDALQHSRRIERSELRGRGTFWVRLKRRWAYFLLARLDPHIARRQWRSLPD